MGIDANPNVDLARMLAYKDEGVKGNMAGIEFLLKKNKIDVPSRARPHRRLRAQSRWR